MPTSQPLPLIGVFAIQEGLLSKERVEALLLETLDASQDDGSDALARRFLRDGLLHPAQVKQLQVLMDYHRLRFEDAALGALAVKRGLVSREVVRYSLEAQCQEFLLERRLPRRLGTILVESKVLTAEQIDALLTALGRARKKTAPTGRTKIPPLPQRPAPAPPSRAKKPPLGWLVMEFGDAIGRRFPLDQRCILGRPPLSDVSIPDPQISRQHAEIEVHPANGLAVLTDLQSRNGTYVNHRRIDDSVVLSPGDFIRIGLTVLRYEPATATEEQLNPRLAPPPDSAAAGSSPADFPLPPPQPDEATHPIPILRDDRPRP
jgi:hypothetical protein